MLTVSISINNKTIYTLTVVNRLKETGYYICDDGSKIKYNQKDGAVKLAIKALKTIKEVKYMPTNDFVRIKGFYWIHYHNKVLRFFKSIYYNLFFKITLYNHLFIKCEKCGIYQKCVGLKKRFNF